MTPLQHPLAIGVLTVATALTGWWVWTLREAEPPAQLTGPPRSDYQVDNFELLAFDEQGKEAFSLRGPRLARHPFLGTIEIEQPRLRMPAADTQAMGGWQGRADRGWISSDADRVKLMGKVDLRGPIPVGQQPMRLRAPAIELLPRENRALSDDAVTITGPGSILRGRGMRADLDARRIELLAEVTGRYEPPPR